MTFLNEGAGRIYHDTNCNVEENVRTLWWLAVIGVQGNIMNYICYSSNTLHYHHLPLNDRNILKFQWLQKTKLKKLL